MRWTARVDDRVHEVELIRRPDGTLTASVDGRAYQLSVTQPQPLVYSILAGGRSHEAIVQLRQGQSRVRVGSAIFTVESEQQRGAAAGGMPARAARGRDGRHTVAAIMPGRILRVLVVPGQEVTAKQGLLVIEAMKMENEMSSPRAGVVREVKVQPGRTVESGEPLIVIE